jgi:membrane protease YdiL (CAAX protease family)
MQTTSIMLRTRVLILSVLPLILNGLATPAIVISLVSLPRFLEDPFYYIYTYGYFLWPVYHVILAGIALWFIKTERESVREVIGPVMDRPRLTAFLTIALLAFSLIIFQLAQPLVTELIYGPEAWEQVLSGFRRLSQSIGAYSLVVPPITAGVCEELVWRGYLLTRFERLLHRAWMAILLQAILFGLWHGVSLFTLFSVIMGLVAGFVYAKTRRLVPIMVSHWLGDLAGLALMYFI